MNYLLMILIRCKQITYSIYLINLKKCLKIIVIIKINGNFYFINDFNFKINDLRYNNIY